MGEVKVRVCKILASCGKAAKGAGVVCTEAVGVADGEVLLVVDGSPPRQPKQVAKGSKQKSVAIFCLSVIVPPR